MLAKFVSFGLSLSAQVQASGFLVQVISEFKNMLLESKCKYSLIGGVLKFGFQYLKSGKSYFFAHWSFCLLKTDVIPFVKPGLDPVVQRTKIVRPCM
jgi:hypothetical protein